MQTVKGKYSFQVGITFNSYEELQERMALHSQESLVYYWRRDTRTVQGAFMKTSRPIAEHLKYYSVRYACVYGGQKFRSRGQGRRQTQTLRSDCPSFIMLRASKCGQKLEVIAVCNEHNHEISEMASKCLPHKRKLPDNVKEEVVQMLMQNIDRRKIIDHVFTKTSKLLTQKDLHNLRATYKQTQTEAKNDNVEVVRMIDKNKFDSNEILWDYSSDEINSNDAQDFVEHFSLKTSTNQSVTDNECNPSIDEHHEMEQECIDYIHTTDSMSCNQTTPDQCLPESLLTNDSNMYKEEKIEESIESPFDEAEAYCIIEETLEEPFSETNQHLFVDSIEENYQEEPINEPIIDESCIVSEQNSDSNNIEEILENPVNSPKSNDEISSKCDSLPVKRPGIMFKYFTKNASRRNRRLKQRLCKYCGGNSKLVKMQIEVLSAQKQKLLEETQILRLTKMKLITELSQLQRKHIDNITGDV